MLYPVNNIFLNKIDFDAEALKLFRYQYQHNNIYQKWCDALHIDVNAVNNVAQIPFIPISFFKTKILTCGDFDAEVVFESSGTTGSINSKHFVKDTTVYEDSFNAAFNLFYGDVKDYCIIGLLPSYLERNNSSLVYMVNSLIKQSNHKRSGFYLHDVDKLSDTLQQLEATGTKTLLIGVTFALLDFAASHPQKLHNTIIIETGGMKGRKEEMTRAEVHAILKHAFGLNEIHSEYGMTELLSQAYAICNGIFSCPPWMKVFIRDEDDPLQIKQTGRGVINIIDLANVYSCAFIATDDVGIINNDGSFEIMGRRDNSDLRGCSLLAL